MTDKDRQTADDDIEIVEAPEPLQRTTVVDAGTVEKPEADQLGPLKEAVAAAQKETENERTRRANAERERDEARGRVQSEIDARFSSNEVAIQNALAAYAGQEANLKADLATASSKGDHAKIADLIDSLAEVKANRKAAEAQAANIKTAKEKLAKEAEELAKRPADSLGQFTPQTRQWFEKNPDYQPGKALNQKAIEADGLALRAGYRPDTPEYFNYVDTFLGLKAPAEQQQEPQKVTTKPQSMPAAAPPSRGNGSGVQKTPQKITLTAREREVAVATQSLGKTEQERIENYAKNKIALIKEGRLPADGVAA